MSSPDVKGDLHDYLRGARETLVWKLDGLGEYDIRRPLTSTGTNLLGLVTHNAGTHLRYFGDVFGRTPDVSLPWASDDAEPNADLWAKPEETREDILTLYRRTWELADATIDGLPLDALAWVPWWGRSLTLHQVLVHVTSETQRHAGHADIIRELIDGAAGLLHGHDNLRIDDSTAWRRFRDQIEDAARLANGPAL
ncbi:MAG TPA: DinB family protein [Acidimicrobiales bacterium]|nr:DinB family protein [Acidimicrobiales bacterium]